GQRAFNKELEHFSKLDFLKSFAPSFLGIAESEAWKGMLFEFIEDREPLPPWTTENTQAIATRIVDLHATPKPPTVEHLSESEFNRDLWQGVDGWVQLAGSKDKQAGF